MTLSSITEAIAKLTREKAVTNVELGNKEVFKFNLPPTEPKPLPKDRIPTPEERAAHLPADRPPVRLTVGFQDPIIKKDPNPARTLSVEEENQKISEWFDLAFGKVRDRESTEYLVKHAMVLHKYFVESGFNQEVLTHIEFFVKAIGDLTAENINLNKANNEINLKCRELTTEMVTRDIGRATFRG